jgi:hypothetical protein
VSRTSLLIAHGLWQSAVLLSGHSESHMDRSAVAPVCRQPRYEVQLLLLELFNCNVNNHAGKVKPSL